MKEENGFALLPIIVFLIIFLGIGIGLEDFYYMPVIVAFLIALLVAFLQNRKLSFEDKVSVIARGLGEENIVTMCLIFLSLSRKWLSVGMTKKCLTGSKSKIYAKSPFIFIICVLASFLTWLAL